MSKSLAILLFLFFAQDMTMPKVEHHKETRQETTDYVTSTCPEGYEGHFVDVNIGFDWDYWSWTPMSQGMVIGTVPGYTICFKKSFMDQVRKSPDMLRARPEPPHPAQLMHPWQSTP